MSLSSNTIVHFTKYKKSLTGILSNNFNITYCHEIIEYQNGKYHFLVPIVSFSDIPFSQILDHIDSYGCYGIGLKKSWAEKNGLNPVLYIEKNSILAENLCKITPSYILHSSKNESIDKMTTDDRNAFDYIRYLKNYQGDLIRKGKTTKKNYRFSDEREWRYALNPKLEHLAFAHPEKTNSEDIIKIKKELNEKINENKLVFEPDDINYIIIKSEKERNSIIKIIEETKEKYSLAEVKRLVSRIISTEQLKTDF